MLWARFSNLFPRDEAFRLKRTRNSEGTGGDGPIMAHSKPINPTAPTSASTGRSMNVEDSSSQRGEAEAEESEFELEEDLPLDSSASYIPPSLSRKRNRSTSTTKDRTPARRSLAKRHSQAQGNTCRLIKGLISQISDSRVKSK